MDGNSPGLLHVYDSRYQDALCLGQRRRQQCVSKYKCFSFDYAFRYNSCRHSFTQHRWVVGNSPGFLYVYDSRH
jgi:hypothetical protein